MPIDQQQQHDHSPINDDGGGDCSNRSSGDSGGGDSSSGGRTNESDAVLNGSHSSNPDGDGCSGKELATTAVPTSFSKQRISLDVILSNGESNASSLVSNSVPEQTTLVSVQ